MFAPAVTTPAGDEVGATGVLVAVVAKLVETAPDAEVLLPMAVVPERNVEGEGVLTNTVVEVTVLEEPGRGIDTGVEIPGTLETPGTLVETAPGVLMVELRGGGTT